MSLTKASIVEEIFKKTDFTKRESVEIVELVFKIIKETLAQGEKVKISGFGNFSTHDKEKRLGRNPQTGETLEISSRRVLTFRPSQVLKDDISSRYAHRIGHSGEEDESVPLERGTSRALSNFMGGSAEMDSAHDDEYEYGEYDEYEEND